MKTPDEGLVQRGFLKGLRWIRKRTWVFKGSTEATELLSVSDSSLFTDSEGGDQTHPAELMFLLKQIFVGDLMSLPTSEVGIHCVGSQRAGAPLCSLQVCEIVSLAWSNAQGMAAWKNNCCEAVSPTNQLHIEQHVDEQSTRWLNRQLESDNSSADTDAPSWGQKAVELCASLTFRFHLKITWLKH